MKTKSFLAVVLLMVCGTSYAQFSNTGSLSSSSSSSSNGNWSTFYVQWNPSSFNYKYEDDSDSFTGISLGYNHAFALSESVPIYMEMGIGGQYSFQKESEKNYEYKLNVFSAKVPLNLAYKIDVPNSSVSIIPFVGLTGRFNISAETKEKEYGRKEETTNLFDKDLEDFEKMKRFQVGWQAGLNFKLNKVILGASYGTDFSEIGEETKVHTGSVTLGVCF